MLYQLSYYRVFPATKLAIYFYFIILLRCKFLGNLIASFHLMVYYHDAQVVKPFMGWG